MASRRIEDLHPVLQDVFQTAQAKWNELHPDGPQAILTCTYRSGAEQNKLFAQGRSSPGKKVTNAKAGQSPHNYMPSFAFDVGFQKAGKLDWTEKLFRDFAKLIADPRVEWGGGWKFLDLPHFELRGWKKK